MRRRFRGKVREPKIGDKQDKKTRHMLKSGFRKLLIRNEKDMELLLMNNRSYAGEIAQCISAKTRYVYQHSFTSIESLTKRVYLTV